MTIFQNLPAYIMNTLTENHGLFHYYHAVMEKF
jgi:hypothetical protein